jgi:CBS domain containing-hemolysin-like protein
MRRTWRSAIRWSVFIAAVTFAVSSVVNTSTVLLDQTEWVIGTGIVVLIIAIGIFFDMLGLAAAAARETPFHAMAAEKVPGAKHAISIVRNAEKFSNFCSDVVGDMLGILSGAAVASVAGQLIRVVHTPGWQAKLLVILSTALVAALTVGGKAIGKALAIRNSTIIVLRTGQFFYWLDTQFHIRLFSGDHNKKPRKRGGGRVAR